MCLFDMGRLCCTGTPLDFLLCGLNFLLMMGCGATAMTAGILRLNGLRDSGDRIAHANSVKEATNSSSNFGPSSCMRQLEDYSDGAFMLQMYTLSLYTFYTLLDFMAACSIAFLYYSDFLEDLSATQVETFKRQKQGRHFQYWIALQFLLILALIFYGAFTWATGDVNPHTVVLTILFVSWKFFYGAIHVTKLVFLERNRRDSRSRNEEHAQLKRRMSVDSVMTERRASEESRNSRLNLSVNLERDLDAKSEGEGTDTDTDTSDE